MRDEWVIYNFLLKDYQKGTFSKKEAAIAKAEELNNIAVSHGVPKYLGVVPKTRFYDERQSR